MSEHCPNVIASCESWLSSSDASAKIFPTGYSIHRSDGSDWIVFDAYQYTLISERLTIDVNVEVVACRNKQKELHQPLIICQCTS